MKFKFFYVTIKYNVRMMNYVTKRCIVSKWCEVEKRDLRKIACAVIRNKAKSVYVLLNIVCSIS